MFCPNCGQEAQGQASFCINCGQAFGPTPVAAQPAPLPQQIQPQPQYQAQPQQYQPQLPALVGYSSRINDPAFKKYKKKSAAWALIFAAVLALIAAIGFPVYGSASGKIDFPNSLYYGLGIGGMFILIALIQIIKTGFDKTWNGVVKDKKSYQERDRNDDNGAIGSVHTVYVLKIKKDSGGTKKHKWRDLPGPYGYYNIGDKVRHNKGLFFYEKYDKSRDAQILCAACMAFVDIHEEYCPRCKCPLLK